MKILHWDEMFHPSFGYQINVLAKYQAMQGHEVIILTGEKPDEHPTFKGLCDCDINEMDKQYQRLYNVKIIRLPIYRVISGMVIYKWGFLKKIKELAPDILMCHTNDTITAMITAWAYRYLDMPIIFDNHMLEIAAVNPLHKLFVLFIRYTLTPLIKKNKWIVIRTQNDPYVYDAYRIPLEQAPFVSFGSDMSIFHPDIEVRKNFRNQLGLNKDDFVIVYTGKLSEGKGGKLLASCLLKKFSTKKNVVAVIVGSSRGEYESLVEDTFKQSELKVLRFPTQNYLELPKFYQIADLFLCAKQCSLSFYDAQACGVPVVAENNTVNIERVSHGNGFVFLKDDVIDFRKKIEICINMDPNEYNLMKKNAYNFVKEKYDYTIISNQYSEMMQTEILKFKGNTL